MFGVLQEPVYKTRIVVDHLKERLIEEWASFAKKIYQWIKKTVAQAPSCLHIS
jgi:hypothetical protein